MLSATIFMGVIAAVLLYLGYSRGGGEHITGVKWAITLTVEILPLLLFAFIVAGMVQVLIPKEVITNWIGAEAGLKGIIIGSLAGGLAPGGPFISLPVAAGLLRAGAGVGTSVAFITGWSVLAFARIPMEVGILGWRFTFIRLTSSLVLPVIAGLIAQFIFSEWGGV